MPYTNVPESLWGKMDDCVKEVQGQGHSKESAVAICHESIVKGKELLTAIKEYTAKETGPSSDYLIVENPDSPTTYHLRVKMNGKLDHTLMGAAWAALHGGYRGNVYEGPGKEEAIGKLKRLYESENLPLPSEKEATLTVFKDASGGYRWVMATSSSFRDRDNEIVSQKALEADADRMNTSGKYGTLDWWHTPIILGQCDFSAMHGRVSIESGTITDSFIGERLATAKETLAASRAFYHPITEPDKDGVYTNITTFSRAVLPRDRASNLLTSVLLVKEETPMFEKQIEHFKALLGGGKPADDKVAELLAQAEKMEKAAADAGIAFKETEPPAAPTPPPDKKPDPPAAEKAWFLADMKPEEYVKLTAETFQAVLAPSFKELQAHNDAELKAKFDGILGEIKKIADAQIATAKAFEQTAKEVKELNSLKPRAFRASEDPSTVTEKSKNGPGPDEKASHFAAFVGSVLTGQAPQ